MLDRYFEQARSGAIADGTDPLGPLCVIGGAAGPEQFLTLSTWSFWTSIEACTGGDIRRPLVTRNASLIVEGGPVHYEILSAVEAGRPGEPAPDGTPTLERDDVGLQAH
jgi:hypothetical protein